MSDEGGEKVNCIVNPWFFYLVEVAGDTKEAFGLIALCSLALFSAYWIDDNHEEKIWIITESDRSSTTVLFPSDY